MKLKQTAISFLATALLVLLVIPLFAKDAPTIRVSYIFTTHHEPFMVAMSQGEKFKDLGIWFKEIVPKEKYDLYVNGEKKARLNVIVAKSGSETAVLFAQKHIDIGFGSLPAMMTALDKGTAIKVLAPLHADGIGLVVPQNSPYGSWDSFLSAIKSAKRPIKVGYHSPTSAPRIMFESAMFDNGISVAQRPGVKAQILLVDLKSTSNLIPALISGQVDAWVGPAPFPEMAELRGAGKILMDLRDLPPAGKWSNFPCCVMAAREEILSSNRDEVKALLKMMTKTAAWCNENKEEAGKLAANWIGIPAEAAEKSTIVYTTDPSENWLRGAAIYMTYLDKMNKFNGEMKGKKLSEVNQELFDFTLLK